MGMTSKEYERLTGKKFVSIKSSKPQREPSQRSIPDEYAQDECYYCDKEILEAGVTDMSLPGIYHVKCIPLEKCEREEYERVKLGGNV